MPPVLEQTSYNSVGKSMPSNSAGVYTSNSKRTATATFSKPTKPGSLIVVVEVCAGALPVGLKGPAGFLKLLDDGLRDLEMCVWYLQNAPSMSQVTVGYDPLTPRSIQVRAFEYSGMAQSNVLDVGKVVIKSGESSVPISGNALANSQADSLALAFIANQYDTTTQSGFIGNLTRFYENTSVAKEGNYTNVDWERSRLTTHQSIATALTSFTLKCALSTTRRWICLLVCFKGGSSGPARMTCKSNTKMLDTHGGRASSMSCFGPLTAKLPENTRMLTTDCKHARIGPSNYQYRLGGWSGLLIGSTTKYHVEGTEGLYGWQIRDSDAEQPRGVGSLRGIDLQSARQALFKMNVGKGRDEVERNMDTLMRSLVPQTEEDWELIWRHPTQPMKMMRVRPVENLRNRDKRQQGVTPQSFVLKAVDPRHYSAIPNIVKIPVTPTAEGFGDPLLTNVFNIGNVPAYPIITVRGPSSGAPVTSIQLVNLTALVSWEVELVLSKGSILVGDMEARSTGAPRNIIALDGQSKYGSWQLPRDPFRIDPDPTGFGGYNNIYVRTTPPGSSSIQLSLEYRDTWAG